MSSALGVSATLRAPAGPAVERIEDFAFQRLAAWADEPALRILSVPAPVAPAERLLDLSDLPYGVLWDPPEGPSIAGVGAAQLLELAGSGRFARLRDAARAAGRRLLAEAHPDSLPARPRWLGGLAFDVGAAAADPWREFGDGCFTLPRFTYTRHGDRASLSLALGEGEAPGPAERLALTDELGELLAGLGRRPAPEVGRPAPPLRVQKPSRQRWNAQIEEIRAAIGEGLFAKIVAARRSVVELAGPGEASAILGRLARGLRASTRFAFCRSGSIFLGATPERLIARSGLEIRTEALAGSIASGAAEQAVELLNSRKDLEEHRLVVEEIVRRLEPLCERLTVAAKPQIRELREVLHLRTPILGTLERPLDVVDLVEVLHPTPAVGGVPTEDALRWIASHEPAPRGWYAGPIGWLDAAGDGEFAVALRSCLLRGEKAFLYAGAGIVAGSDPHLEYQETELKKQTLLAALGA